ncbi:MAG: 16S rRNA (cytosine(1402)-N(4))-methyltransferase RsmH [Alicyclobacillaceae bacterium]|nr:16S rRNA (cytosine(1402)-N(4))-methyltransferase RsmH [Alicyclobacillaceae bacterium]
MFHHEPVLLREAVEALAPRSGGVYVDGTLGGGGHAEEILRRSSPDGRLVGIDQDESALAAAAARLAPFGGRVTVVKGNFRRIGLIVRELGFDRVDGILFDVGMSSVHVDEAERGFSYRRDAPLDMRMDRSAALTAREIVNGWAEEELTRIFREYGEERWAARIAAGIVRRRSRKPIETTGELVEIILDAVPAPARRRGPHPARRTFQALRIAVNDELEALKEGVYGAIGLLKPGGRLAVITFHSLEDRIVKRIFQEESRTCVCPPGTPVCACGYRPRLRLFRRKPIEPGQEEIERNPRSRSAKLRVAERTEANGE